MTVQAFIGAKIALIAGDSLVTYLRDDTPDIPFPNMWDLPGGGREGDESPEACALRETHEEFGLHLPETRIIWRERFASNAVPGRVSYFFAAPISEAEIAAIRFGDEGQYWQMMRCAEFLAHPKAVGFLKTRLAAFLNS